MAALPDRRHERVAQLLAVMKTAAEASAEAGYDTKALSFESNAKKRACRPDIKARVAELQSAIAACAVIDAAWICGKAAAIGGITLNPEEIKPTDVIAALNLLAKMTPGALVPQKVTATNPEGDGPMQVIEIVRFTPDKNPPPA